MTNLKGKYCRSCGDYKVFEDYHDNKEMKDGKSSYCKPCASERSRLWKERNKSRAKDTELRFKYGISLADHVALFTKQGGKCAICGVEEADTPKGALYVDHCHTTGAVRGLLCHHCNTGLGNFKDDPDTLSAAILYLTKEERGCSPP